MAGLLLKISLFGLIRFILSSFYCSIRFISSLLLFIVIVGLINISFSYFRYYDLKKIIALSSIIHLNLSLIGLLMLSSISLISGLLLTISHSFSSFGLFLVIGCIINKTNIRLIDSLCYCGFNIKLMLFFLMLANISFPLSINFIAELFMIIALVNIDIPLLVIVLLILVVNCLFWFLVINVKISYCNCYYSLSYNWMMVVGLILLYIYGFGTFYLIEFYCYYFV